MNKNPSELREMAIRIEDALLYFEPDYLHEICRQLTWFILCVGSVFGTIIGIMHLNEYFQEQMYLAKKREKESDRRRTKLD